jgi:hypothetical protein
MEVVWSRPLDHSCRWSGPLVLRVVVRIASGHEHLQHTRDHLDYTHNVPVWKGNERCYGYIRMDAESREDDAKRAAGNTESGAIAQ